MGSPSTNDRKRLTMHCRGRLELARGGWAPGGVEVGGAVEADAPGAGPGGVLDEAGPVDGDGGAGREFAGKGDEASALGAAALGLGR